MKAEISSLVSSVSFFFLELVIANSFIINNFNIDLL